MTEEQGILRLQVASLARRRGIERPNALAEQIGRSRQTATAVWNSRTGGISLALYGELCTFFEVSPGAWFAWEDNLDGTVRLRWNVRSEAKGYGISLSTLGYRAELDASRMRAIWRGEPSIANFHTLTRIARAIEPYGPFDIGGLFVWQKSGHMPAFSEEPSK